MQWLVNRLITVVDRPSRRPLFDQVRKLIPTKQQMLYDSLLPHAAAAVDARIRVIRIAPKTLNQPLGFSVRGGFEHGIGFYVSEVERDSAVSVVDNACRSYFLKVSVFYSVLSITTGNYRNPFSSQRDATVRIPAIHH